MSQHSQSPHGHHRDKQNRNRQDQQNPQTRNPNEGVKRSEGYQNDPARNRTGGRDPQS
jgi:hypothetical protein